jgi:transcriptional regulator with XRE-family HTH domain
MQHITTQQNISIETLQRKTHLTMRQIKSMWDGEDEPSVEMMAKMSKVLGVRVADLLEEEPAWMGNSYFGGRVH